MDSSSPRGRKPNPNRYVSTRISKVEQSRDGKKLKKFGKPNIDSYLREKPLLKEFNKPYSAAIIAHCPREMKILFLILRNIENKTSPAVNVSPNRGKV